MMSMALVVGVELGLEPENSGLPFQSLLAGWVLFVSQADQRKKQISFCSALIF
jgi:hypothetical protein